MKLRAKDLRFDKALPYFVYIFPNKNDNNVQTKNEKIKLGIDFGENPARLSIRKDFILFMLGLIM